MNKEFERWKASVQEERAAQANGDCQLGNKLTEMKESQEGKNAKIQEQIKIPQLTCIQQCKASKKILQNDE